MIRITIGLVRMPRRVLGMFRKIGRRAEFVDRVEHLEDSVAALRARDDRGAAVPWRDVRDGG